MGGMSNVDACTCQELTFLFSLILNINIEKGKIQTAQYIQYRENRAPVKQHILGINIVRKQLLAETKYLCY